MFANLFREIFVQVPAKEKLLQPTHDLPDARIDATPMEHTFLTSFISQRNHRIDASSAAGWNETGGQCDRNQHAGCHGKGEWIVWPEIEKQRTRPSGGGESKDNAGAAAKNQQHQRCPKDDADNSD